MSDHADPHVILDACVCCCDECLNIRAHMCICSECNCQSAS